MQLSVLDPRNGLGVLRHAARSVEAADWHPSVGCLATISPPPARFAGFLRVRELQIRGEHAKGCGRGPWRPSHPSTASRADADRVLHIERPLPGGAASYIASNEARASGPPLQRGAQPRLHSRQRVDALGRDWQCQSVSLWWRTVGSAWSRNDSSCAVMVRRSVLCEQPATRAFTSMTWPACVIRIPAADCSRGLPEGLFTAPATYQPAANLPQPQARSFLITSDRDRQGPDHPRVRHKLPIQPPRRQRRSGHRCLSFCPPELALRPSPH